MSRKRPARDVAPDAAEGEVLAPFMKDPAVWAGIGLVAITIAVFAAIRHFDFISLDDPGYVSKNTFVTGGLTWPDIVWAWTTGHAANWHPLTWMSHMLDVELFGLRPGGHHAVSLGFHVINTVLLFVLLRAATGAVGRSAFVAALFAIHPMHVESVAWVAERKDVLSTMFWMLTMIAYVGYVRRPAWHRYLLVCLSLALGLASKPMLVTLPFVLLLFDVWPLGRLQPKTAGWRPLIVEKIPLFAIAVASSVVTFMVQRQGGAVTGLGLLPFETRVENALVAYARYIGKLVWPADLALFYPYDEHLPMAWVVGSALMLVVGSVLALRAMRSRPYLTVGWFWFVGTLVPVIGLVQVGTQSIADRYTYVPYIGLSLALAWWVSDAMPRSRRMLPALAVIVVAALGVTAHAQVQVWKNSWSVWSHALESTTGNYIAHNEIGIMLVAQGKHDEALPHFEEASRIKPEYVEARNNLGLEYLNRGRVQDAIAQYRLAIQLKPDIAQHQNNLGFALMATGNNGEAVVHFTEAIRLNPDLADAHNNLGFILAQSGRMADAIQHFRESIRLQPDGGAAHLYLAMALEATNQLDDAEKEFREVLRLDPTNTGAKDEITKLQTIKARGRGRGGG